MSGQVLEVKSGVLQTFDGEQVEIEGGAWLSPEAFLHSSAELDQLRRREAASMLPFVAGAALLGFAAGLAAAWWALDDE